MTENSQRSIQGVDLPELDEEAQQAFFNDVIHCASLAEDKAGRFCHDIDIAGVRIRLAFAGERMAEEFMPALAHLLVEPGEHYDAIFHVWDTETTGVQIVRPPCPWNAFTSRGDIWGMSSKRFRSAFHFSEYSVCVLDTESGIGSYWVNSASALPYWAKSSPMRTMFSWLLEDRGLFLLHAAVAGDEDGAVLITGKGGVGKSTSSLNALAQGMKFVGDDYVVVSLNNGPEAHALYSTAKVVPAQLALMPGLAKLVDAEQPETDEKAILYLHPERSDQIARSIPIKWLVTPRFGDQPETTFEAVSPIELHQAAAFTTMSQLPHSGQATHQFIGNLMQHLQTARIVLGNNPQSVPTALCQLLAGTITPPEQEMHTVKPLISVIIPVYNGTRFLGDAVASILAQNYPAIEIIIVDDGSTDDVEVAVNDLPVDVRFFSQPNSGPAVARNRGIRDAAGELIAFLDVDDLWPAQHLDALLEAMDDDTEVVLGRAQLARIDIEDQSRFDFIGNPEEAFPYYIGAALYRRSAFRRVGLFDPELRFGEDSDWFLRARDCGLVVKKLEQTTLIVRRHENNMTNGKTLVELNPLRAFKKALDRRRAQTS